MPKQPLRSGFATPAGSVMHVNEMDAYSPEMNWEQFDNGIKSCRLCEGLNSVELGTLNAPGYGNKNSKVVLIGQSLCGKPCIEAQTPFTGGSGKLLDEAFQVAGVSKKDIYITNVVKCHPPQ